MLCPECRTGSLRVVAASRPFCVVCDNKDCHFLFTVEDDGKLSPNAVTSGLLAGLEIGGEIDASKSIEQWPLFER